jgi:hypothetical protein
MLDLDPTYVHAAGVTPAADLDGGSLLPLFTGAADRKRPAIFWHFPGYLDKPVPRGRAPVFLTHPAGVIRQGDWKLPLYHEGWLLGAGVIGLPSTGRPNSITSPETSGNAPISPIPKPNEPPPSRLVNLPLPSLSRHHCQP